MFSLIGIGERAGSGLMNIEVTWKEQKLPKPILTERFSPDRTILTLPLICVDDENVGINTKNVGIKDKNVGINDENVGIKDKNVGINYKNVGINLTKTENKIFEFIKNNSGLTAADLAIEIAVDTRTIERGLKKLRDNNLIERVGSNKSGKWKIICVKEK